MIDDLSTSGDPALQKFTDHGVEEIAVWVDSAYVPTKRGPTRIDQRDGVEQ